MSKSIQVSSFVVPYSQEVLGCAEGLSTQDLAASIRTTKDNIRRVLKKSSFLKYAEDEGLNIRTIVSKIKKRGRPVVDVINYDLITTVIKS